jgi:hypothetical protein
MRREGKIEFSDAQEALPNFAPSPADEASRREEQAMVWAALSRLPESYREPLVLFYRQEQSISEVASGLELSADVVKQRLSRGRKMLRDEVLSAVERTLKRSAPTRAFTVTVMATLPAFSATSAAAATGGATSALTQAAIATGAPKAAAGILGSAIGGILGFGGAAFGTWASWTTASYQSQRKLIIRSTITYIIGLAVFLSPFAAMVAGWRPQQMLGANGYLIVYGIWMTAFMAANVIWMARTQRAWNRITKQEHAAGTTELPATALRRWLAKWEGRRWQSRRTLWGWPLLDIAFSNPGGWLNPADQSTLGRARGWIAVGDSARGGLLAMGNVAIAPIAFGTMSAGIVSAGVMSTGIFSIGVISLAIVALGILSLGWWSIGGAVALGSLAAGPVAIGWHAAWGAVAVAFDFADGAKSIAEHAGDAFAKQYFADSEFFQWATYLLERIAAWSPHLRQPWFFAIILGSGPIAWLAAYRRKPHVAASTTPT